MTGAADIAVIVPAHDAAATVAGAVRSALGEPRVREVCVVDDASQDRTAAAAEAADDGTGRLRVVRLSVNGGPARARNVAIERTAAPLVALLDADDRFVPGRFDHLPPPADWDLFADNVMFLSRAEALDALAPVAPLPVRLLDAAAFVRGNLSRRDRPRGELGFLKPVMSRSFLDRHALRYREDLRLGEDYDLYLRALLRGARFAVAPQAGYAALVRDDSLSVRHATADLAALAAADGAALREPDLPRALRRALRLHRRQTLARHALRRLLDRRAEAGRARALAEACGRPGDWAAITAGLARDKWHALRDRQHRAPAPTLFSSDAPPGVAFLRPGPHASRRGPALATENA